MPTTNIGKIVERDGRLMISLASVFLLHAILGITTGIAEALDDHGRLQDLNAALKLFHNNFDSVEVVITQELLDLLKRLDLVEETVEDEKQ